MNSLTKGFKFEEEMVKSLDMKKLSQLNPNLQSMVKKIFDVYDEDMLFQAKKCDPRGKPDIWISYDGVVKYVSLKTGKSKNLHAEDIKKFVLGLREAGISEETQKSVLLFQYGDRTMDGSGKYRYDFEDIFQMMRKRIAEMNEELNSDKDFIADFIDRIIFAGNDENLHPADYIYHGTLESGFLISRRVMRKYIKSKDYDKIFNPHIGPVHFHPYARYVDKQIPEDKKYKRDIVHFNWVGILDDFEYISKRYKTDYLYR